jgi:hypothetical protein
MTTARHTPGDWWLDADESAATGVLNVYAGDEARRVVATVDPDGWIEDDDGREPVIANGKLIAAAPKLLEALRVAADRFKELAVYTEIRKSPKDTAILREWEAAARAAVAKAVPS